MSKITVWFIRCAMVYFLIATILGLHMAVVGTLQPYYSIHVHFNLLGWMSMMIYGVAYHILPRFSGRPLYSDRLAEVQFWLANIGLLGMALGWAVTVKGLLVVFSVAEVLSVGLFVINIFKTIRPAPVIVK